MWTYVLRHRRSLRDSFRLSRPIHRDARHRNGRRQARPVAEGIRVLGAAPPRHPGWTPAASRN